MASSLKHDLLLKCQGMIESSHKIVKNNRRGAWIISVEAGQGGWATPRYILQVQETSVNHTFDIAPNRHGGSDRTQVRVFGTHPASGGVKMKLTDMVCACDTMDARYQTCLRLK